MSQPRRNFYHPASGLAILGFDWLFFGLEWQLGPVSLAAGVPFTVGGTAVGGLILLLSGLERLRLPRR